MCAISILSCVILSPSALATVKYGVNGDPLAPVWNKESVFASDAQQDYNNGGSNNVRIPNMLLKTSTGALLSFVELRNGTTDANCYAIACRISTNQGKTWGDPFNIVTLQPPRSTPTIKLTLGAAFELADGRIGLIYTHWTTWDTTLDNSRGEGMTVNVLYTTDGTDYTDWVDDGAAPTAGEDITSQVVKTNNTTPADLPTTLDTTNDNWTWLVCTDATTLSNGEVIVAANYRYDDVDVSRFCALRRNTDGTWDICGGLEESDATNNDMNEGTIVQTNGTHLLVFLRDRDNSAFKWCKSADDGDTWGDGATSVATTTGLTNCNGDVQPDACVDPDDSSKVYFAAPRDGNVRCNMTVWRVSVTAGTPTFGADRIFFDGWAGYPGIAAFSGKIVLIHECTNNFHASGTNGYSHWYQYIRQVTFADSDLDEADSPIDFQFNEKSSGAMVTGSVVSHGMPISGDGQTAWSYNSSGIVADGTNGCPLERVRTNGTPTTATNTNYSAWNCRNESFTAEVIIDTTSLGTAATSYFVMGTRNNTGAGWRLTAVGSTRNCTFSLGDDAAHSQTNTNSASLANGIHVISAVYDRDAATMRVYVDGVAAQAASSTSALTGNLYVNNLPNLGKVPNASGTPATIPSGVVFHRARFTRKALTTSEFLTTSSVKKSLPIYAGGWAEPAFSPRTLYPSTCKLHLLSFADGGSGLSGDVFQQFAPLKLPPTSRVGYGSAFDYAQNVMFTTPSNSLNRTWHSGYDATVGPFVRFYTAKEANPTGVSIRRSAADSAYDVTQTDCKFTIIIGAIKFRATTGADQVILDNRNNTGSNRGFTVKRDNSLKMGLASSYLEGGTTSRVRIGDTSTASISNDTWYSIAYVQYGDNTDGDFFYGAWANGAPPTDLTRESTGTVAFNDGSGSDYAATKVLAVSGRVDDSLNGCEMDIKDIIFLDENIAADTAASEAAILTLLQTSDYTGPSGRPPGRIGVGTSIGVASFSPER